MIEVQETQTPREETREQPQVKSFLRETLETLVLTAIIFFAVNFMTGRFKIYGASMDDSFHDGQYIIVSRLAYLLGKPQHGDVVVFVPPGHPEATFLERLAGIPGETDFIKRIIGLPGDTVMVSKGNVSVNGIAQNEPYIKEPMRPYQDQTWTLGPDQYFVLGDNRNFSKDSRDPSVGPISLGRMIGKVWVVYWPLPDWKLVRHYRYP